MGRYRGKILFLILGMLLMAVVFYLAKNRESQSVVYSNKNIRFVFELQNTSRKFLTEAEFRLLLPVNIESRQELLSVKSNRDFFIENKNHGQPYAHFTVNAIPPGGKKTVKVDVEVKLAKHSILEETRGDYTGDGVYVGLGNPRIESVASRLSQGKDYPRRAFEWIRDNIASEAYRVKSKGALYALDNKSGDCTEHMYLYMALSRFAGYPSRGVKGFVVEGSVESVSASQFHNWAEYYDGERWRLVDTQQSVFDKKYDQYVIFGFLDGGFSEDDMPGFVTTNSEISIRL